jgi:DNA polymerase-3 subunit epsilon
MLHVFGPQAPTDRDAVMPHTNLKLERPLCCFDIEATGISPQFDHMIDLALLRLAPDGTRTIHTFRVNPQIPIPPDSTRIHGITDADVRDCPTFREVAPQILSLLTDVDLAGFNLLRFDIPLLVAEFARCDLVYDPTTASVVDAQRIFHRREPRDLTAALAFYCHELHVGAHGALPDAEATLRVIEAQLTRYSDLPRDVVALDAYCNPRHPDWVDREGRLKWSGQEIVLNFGKKKGTPLKSLLAGDPGFVKWILRSDFPPDTKAMIEAAQRGDWPEPPAVDPTRDDDGS